MNIAYLNGEYLPHDEIRISPDDRGFLFADGVYEVARWYGRSYLDMDGHIARLKRSLSGIRIDWPEADSFRTIAQKLINLNDLHNSEALVYLQVTRGAAPRGHAFPTPAVKPTVYSFVRALNPDKGYIAKGVKAILKEDIRWSRCNIKSVSLLPNILSFQEAREAECHECIFVKDGVVTECAHSNIFMVIDGILQTHPESEKILSGITRKNVIRLAHEAGIKVLEEAVPESSLGKASEVFLTNTSLEIAPVISINDKPVGKGMPGPVTMLLREKFDVMTVALKG